MARSYHRVYPGFWDEPFDSDTQLLGLYLLTNRHRLTEGLYRLPKGYVLDDLRWEPERLAAPWSALIEHGFMQYDEQARVVWIVKALERQPPENDNQAKGAARAIAELPPTTLLEPFRKASETVSERFARALREVFPQSRTDPPPPPPPPPHGEREGSRDRAAEGQLHPLLPQILDDFHALDGYITDAGGVVGVLQANSWATDAELLEVAAEVVAWCQDTADPPRMNGTAGMYRVKFQKRSRARVTPTASRPAAGGRRGKETHAEKRARLLAEAEPTTDHIGSTA